MRLTYTRPMPNQEWRNEIVVISTRCNRDHYAVFLKAYGENGVIKKTYRTTDVTEGFKKIDQLTERLAAGGFKYKLKK